MDITKILNLPPVASAHGQDIDMVIYLVHFLMAALLVGWGVFFFYALVRFRKSKSPRADYVGVKSHASTAAEIFVILFEAMLLLGFSIPFWAKQINKFPDRTDVMKIHVIAEQFAWNIHYPGKDEIFGKRDVKYFDKQNNLIGLDPNDPAGKDDVVTINQMHVPIGRPVIVYLTSKDVVHSFSLPEMRVKQDVIPGMMIPTWFTPTKTGKYEIACAQLCGLGHYRMQGFLTVETEEEFTAWMDEQLSQMGGSEDEGYDDFWN